MRILRGWLGIFCLIFGVSSFAQGPREIEKSLEYEYVPELDYYETEDRLSCLEQTVALNFNTRVFAFVDYFAIRNREYSQMVLDRTAEFFPIFEYYLEKHGLPKELKILSIVESGLNTRAISRVGAAGLWQFMPSTGRLFGLHSDWYVDERMDPYKATEAACKYMKELYGIFGDWELALAAYNAGPGKVRRAIRRSGYKKDFWEVYRYLPRETRSYVPQFVAMSYVYHYADYLNFEVPRGDFEIRSDSVEVNDYLHLPTLASLIGVCEEDMTRLNPGVKRGALPDGMKNYVIRIPSDKLAFFEANRAFIIDSASVSHKKEILYQSRNSVGSTYGRDKVVHRVRSGEVLGTIAAKYGVRISDIRKWNRLSGNLIRIGQRLNIWLLPYQKNNTHSVIAQNRASQKQEVKAQELSDGTKVHLVVPGDTLWDISKKYPNLSIEKIKKLNKLSNSRIKPGQKLIVG